MKDLTAKRGLRCAIYTRVSTEHGLEQDFNSLDAQREASEAYIKSQAHEGWRLARGHYDDGGYSGGSMERPALQKLLDDVRARRLDVIVVYKVHRLTRSLADFAKLVELFDAHQVSFVSVTQAFNTTTSMGRLTLDILPGYLEAGSVVRLKQRLDTEGFRLPVRLNGAGWSTGGGPLSRGHIYKILSNPIYVGQIGHKGQVHEGQHPPIVGQDLWEQVQNCLRAHLGAEHTKKTRQASEAPLARKLFDDLGNRMSPSWAKKGSKRWRYYVSQAALQGDKGKAGSVIRVAAPTVEHCVADAISKQSADRPVLQSELLDLVDRVTIGRTTIQVQLSEADVGARTLTVPRRPPSPYRKREIIQSARDANVSARPMRANARAIFVDALGDSHRWLNELLSAQTRL